ncbi:MAG TPA: hypothetical protein VKW78_18935 [Terriglobales bacterium]|nr:hypothetical protein [Terriglobales bacterium]
MHAVSYLLLFSLLLVVSAPNVVAAQQSTTQNAAVTDTAARDATAQSGNAPVSNQGLELSTRSPGLDMRTVFTVKYVAADAIYLSGGKAAGLAPGMHLTIKRPRPLSATEDKTPAANTDATGNLVVAEVEVEMVAAASTVCQINSSNTPIQPGDLAYVSVSDAEMMVQKRETSGQRKYPQVISFSEGDPLDEEVRDNVPRPPLPEVDRMRGRFGIDYSGINSTGSTSSSYSQIGGVARMDFTRIGGTYWNLNGYWRGRFTSSSAAGQQTLQDLINRTYTLTLNYASPNNNWVAGIGRFYLPWAGSLDTIDGGYLARRLGHGFTSGIFAGSAPDPTSWNYSPDRREGGTFLAYETGSYDSVRFTSTVGAALTTMQWKLDRPFVFIENGIFYKRYISIYNAMQADDPQGYSTPGFMPGPGLGRAIVTVRFQPHRRLSFDANYNYFRDALTFDPRLIATGLVDTLLFQGLSGSVRAEVLHNVVVYTTIGRSHESGDTTNSWNQLYGATWNSVLHTAFRLDARYSKFDGSFGKGTYRSLTVSRNLGERFMGQVQFGDQSLVSTFTSNDSSKFINGMVDANVGRHYFLEGGYTVQRGGSLDYDQWFVTMGYRFDNHASGRK